MLRDWGNRVFFQGIELHVGECLLMPIGFDAWEAGWLATVLWSMCAVRNWVAMRVTDPTPDNIWATKCVIPTNPFAHRELLSVVPSTSSRSMSTRSL
jgi:hypothetical protein